MKVARKAARLICSRLGHKWDERDRLRIVCVRCGHQQWRAI